MLWVVAALVTARAVARQVPATAPPNFDIRTEKTADASAYVRRFATPAAIADAASARAERVAALERAVPQLQTSVSPETGALEVVGTVPGTGFLTDSSADRVATLRAFLSTYAPVYGLSQGQVANLELIADYMNPAGNMGWVEFEQKVNGIPVFRGLLRGGFTADGRLVRTTGPLGEGLDHASLSVTPAFPASEAVSRAAASVGWTVGSMVGNPRAWLVYFPLSPGIARLAWVAEIWGNPDVFMIVLDADDGTVLFRKNLTNYQSQSATYVVYNDDSPAPMSPSTTTPGVGAQAALIGRTLFTLIGNEGPLSFNSLGWITDGNNTTDGNAVEAGLDRDGIDGVDAPVAGVSRVFDFAYNPAPGLPPPGDDPLTAAFQMGEVTDGFYWTNRYHDALYLLGFTEAARNFQNDNFGRGGLGLDRVRGEFQDSSGFNNANFSTAPDGTRGRMQMYIFNGPTPDRTSGLDHDVLIHELTHGTSNRLHNNAAGLTTTMSGGMGEGWSDFYARSILSSASEDPNGIYTTGGWVTYQILAGYVDNYYSGIRRFPYASRSNVGPNGKPHNPLTFADIDSAQVNLTDGAFPPSPLGSPTAFQVHNIGEVWASALFEVRARFIGRYGYAVGNQRFLQIVTDGMKLDPVNPTLLQGRDAILAAATAMPFSDASFVQADLDDIWAGFATRGMGYSAQVVNAGTGSVVEAFDLPGIAANGSSIVAESQPNGRLDAGELVTVSFCMTNVGAITSGSVTGALQSTGGVQSPSASQVYGAIAPGGNTCRTYSFTVGTSCGATLTATLQAQEMGGATRSLIYTMPVGTLAPIMTENFDGVVAPALPAGWTTSTLTGTANLWVTSTTTPDTAPNRASAGNPATVSDNVLLSPTVVMPAASSVLTFRNHYQIESGFDGGVLEISINGGTFFDIIVAGGSWVQGGYNGTVSTCCSNTLSGRAAWTGDSGGYVTTSVNLPLGANGQSVRFRWRMGTDNLVAATGWAIDSIVLSAYGCSNVAPVITTQPLSQTVMPGTGVTLSVDAAGSAPLTYQWYQGSSGDTSIPIAGATSSSYPTPALVAPASYWVRVSNAFGSADSTTATLGLGEAAGVELIANGDFSTPLTGGVAPSSWLVFEEPDIVYSVVGGVFQFYRANPTTTVSGQATIFQNTGHPIAARSGLRATFDIGNSSTARKRISVLLIDSDFSDIAVCTFWLAPGAPLTTYTMRTHTTKNWNNAAIYFYAATRGANGGNYLLDNVSLTYQPAVSTTRTDCVDPTTPPPAGGAPGPNLLGNADFASAALNPWNTFGVLNSQVAEGVFEFIRPAPGPATPAGTVFQATGQAMAANEFMTASFDLGNSSAVRKRVTVLLVSDGAFTDLMACTFWMAPGQPLQRYAMQGRATLAWSDATLYVYAASVGNQTWTRLDNVAFTRTPGTPMLGTECIEPVPPSVGQWAQAGVYPISVLDQGMVTVGGNLYSFGGVSNSITGASYRFNGATWSAIASLPVALEYPSAVTDGASIFIVAGNSGTPQATLYRYNVGPNNYTPLAPATVGTWNQATVYHNGKIYKIGGTGPAAASTNAVEIYDVAANSWSAGAAYPLAASFISAWVQGNFIYTAGGLGTASGVTSKTYRYDPVANVWDDAAIADLPTTRWGAATAFYDGRVVLAGGYVGGSVTASISSTTVSWDQATNTWTAGPSMLDARSRVAGAVLNGAFYVVGGRSQWSPAFVGTREVQRFGSGSPFAEPWPERPVVEIGPVPDAWLAAPNAGGGVASAGEWTNTGGFERDAGSATRGPGNLRWQGVARATGREVLHWLRPIDLTGVSAAQLTFLSSLSSRASSGEVQASVDGITWQTVASVPRGTGLASVDLSPWAGRVVYVRFVFTTVAPASGRQPDLWTIENLSVDMRGHGQVEVGRAARR